MTADTCHEITVPNGKHRVAVHIAQMSFPHMGDQSAAFDLTMTVHGTSVGADALVVRKGQVEVHLMELDIGTPSISQFEHFAHLAVAKMR